MRRALALLVVCAAAGCGGTDAGAERPLVVSAAASLTTALEACSPEGTRLSFAGSDELAGQIRQGVEPDVFAAANTTLPEQLHGEGLAGAPRVFASNELVIAVAAGSDVRGVEDLAAGGLKLAVGAETVPVGAYTRAVLGRLDDAMRRALERSLRSEEPDVKGVIGKVAQGAADAGFAYRTDVAAAGGRLRAVELPEAVRPEVAYAAAVVTPSPAAERYVDGLVSGACQEALREAGFGAPAG